MRPVYFLSLIFFFLSSQLHAQEEISGTNKVSLEMPEPWQHKPKVLSSINELLALYVKEFDDKQFCLKCIGDYTVRFQISNYRLLDKSYVKLSARSYQGETDFAFKGSMLIYDKSDKALLSLVLIDTTIAQRSRYKFNTSEQEDKTNINTQATVFATADEGSTERNNVLTGNAGETPDMVIKRQPPPSYEEFLKIFEDRIRRLAAMKKLN
jgi:hypothetical protein